MFFVSDLLTINGRTAEARQDGTPRISADTGIFDVLGIELVEGRRYLQGEETAAVVTETFARRHYADGSAIGQEISSGATMTIVGVVRDLRLDGPVGDPMPAVISPSGLPTPTLLVRTSGNSRGVMNAIRGDVRAMDPEVVVQQQTLEEALYALDAVSQPRLRAVIVTAFAVVAVLLSLVGISGVASNVASRRTQEIGVRMALGGTRAAIMRMMFIQTMAPVVVGVVIGALGAAALARVLSVYVSDLSTLDPMAFTAAAAVLVATAVVASYLPLRRGTAIHASAALRHE
jgi:ABC-type antimicrobial peptide transport system permease subunit